MIDSDLVKRLALLPRMENIPREELEWLVAQGQLEAYEAGTVIAPKGKRIEKIGRAHV